MPDELPVTFFQSMLVVAGITSLAADRFNWIERMRRYPILQWLFRPYEAADIGWLGGGLHRYLRLTGWFFLVLGEALEVFDHM